MLLETHNNDHLKLAYNISNIKKKNIYIYIKRIKKKKNRASKLGKFTA
jgi:hypothetical protein